MLLSAVFFDDGTITTEDALMSLTTIQRIDPIIWINQSQEY